MALSRFVVTSRVTITPEVAAAVVAGEPGTGGPAGYGNAGTGPNSAGKHGLISCTFEKGTVIYADSTAALTSGAMTLYQAIGASNLRAWTDTDAVGHAGTSN